MTPEQVETLFTRGDGSYLFARWGRPIAPVAFGVEDETICALKGAIEAVCALAGPQMADTDPVLGDTLMMIFCSRREESTAVKDRDRLVQAFVP